VTEHRQAARDSGSGLLRVEVGEQHGQCLADDPAAVRRDP